MLLKNTGLDRRLIQALAKAGITDTKQLQVMSDRELLRLPGIAPSIRRDYPSLPSRRRGSVILKLTGISPINNQTAGELA
jgi:hypothetical protein